MDTIHPLGLATMMATHQPFALDRYDPDKSWEETDDDWGMKAKAKVRRAVRFDEENRIRVSYCRQRNDLLK